jgi:hypothetical protein
MAWPAATGVLSTRLRRARCLNVAHAVWRVSEPGESQEILDEEARQTTDAKSVIALPKTDIGGARHVPRVNQGRIVDMTSTRKTLD